MDKALAEIPGIDYNFTAPMAMRLDEAISGVPTELDVKVFGDDLAHGSERKGKPWNPTPTAKGTGIATAATPPKNPLMLMAPVSTRMPTAAASSAGSAAPSA